MAIQQRHTNLQQVQTCSIIFTRVIFSMCCTESYYTRWQKGVKYASSIKKKVSRYLFWHYTVSKRISFSVPSLSKIVYSYDFVIDESFSSALEYTSYPYSEAMEMCPPVIYMPCDTSSREKTGDIITFTQFEEGNIWTKTRNNT